ncbi:N-formylglutamate amidohydrolase [Sphingomonas sp. SUN039]|uniref:N-formylglutamate amidohydrolase n=1 Tax=Sphingomonas sp. SUN039 TaxID=2937787 RepID=UPI002164C37E|nr:N-formylglutamate amidohydrolase [Sphingomonas sp. SUN039]UVO53878.1 N-formylglutamate amidohydrolase [Sphingomonas sp. SUN039]
MSGILSIVDHASNHVPPDIELGIDPALLDEHIAWDLGAGALADALGYPAHKATVSRLVIDLNREEDAAGLVPLASDGRSIPGNPGDFADRLVRFYHPYHGILAARIAAEHPDLLLSVHSFTPYLRERPDEQRPWEIGVIYNTDDRAARIAIPLLEAAGIVTGDQLPYSGKLLNATMNRHGEANGIPYLGLEVRQDLIGDAAGVARWAMHLRPIVDACLDQLVSSGKAGRL